MNFYNRYFALLILALFLPFTLLAKEDWKNSKGFGELIKLEILEKSLAEKNITTVKISENNLGEQHIIKIEISENNSEVKTIIEFEISENNFGEKNIVVINSKEFDEFIKNSKNYQEMFKNSKEFQEFVNNSKEFQGFFKSYKEFGQLIKLEIFNNRLGEKNIGIIFPEYRCSYFVDMLAEILQIDIPVMSIFINGTKVQMKIGCIGNGKGVVFPKTEQGKQYLISELKTKNSVIYSLKDKELDLSITFSANGFNKEFDNFESEFDGL